MARVTLGGDRLTERVNERRVPEFLRVAIRVALRGYQLMWLAHVAAFIAHLGARQIGKDYSWSFKVAFDMAFREGRSWNIISASQRHATDFQADVRLWLVYLREVCNRAGYDFPEVTQDNAAGLRLDNGSRLKSHAASPRAAQGSRGCVVLNEVGIMPWVNEIFSTALPIVEGAIDNGRDGAMVIITNASVTGSWLHRWWTSSEKTHGWKLITSRWEDCFKAHRRSQGWTKERVKRWLQAKKAARLRRMGQAAYGQWYECLFRSPEEGFFEDHLLDRQMYDPWLDGPPLRDHRLQQVIGWDIGRWRHPSVMTPQILWDDPLTQRGGAWALDGVALHRKPYPAQYAALAQIIGTRETLRVVADRTGPGDRPCEEAAEYFGSIIDPFLFNQTSLWTLASHAKARLQEGRAWIPRSDLDLRMELNGVLALHKAGGGVKVELPEGERAHGDRAVSWMMGLWGIDHGVTLRDEDAETMWDDTDEVVPMSAGVADMSPVGGPGLDDGGW